MRVFNEPVAIDRLSQFDEILKATGGRYLSNPRESLGEGCFRVDYEPGTETVARWGRCLKDIQEIRKDQWYRIFSRRVVGAFRLLRREA